MLVMLPGVRGEDAFRELLRVAREIREKYNIRFDRDAYDPYEALLGILMGIDQLLSTSAGTRKAEAPPKEVELINAVVAEKGEFTEEGVYVWPRHLKETAEELGIDWEEVKKQLKKLGKIEFVKKKGKYRVKSP